jgi:Rieske Fe-S protein
MERRRFIQICVAGAASGAAVPALCADGPRALPAKSGMALKPQKYERVKLTDADGKPVKAKSLKSGTNYVFNYPFATTPCFLLNLDAPALEATPLKTEVGDTYTWPGGVGPNQSIVAYSAICAHKLAYPSKQVSFISYRNKPSPINAKGKVIGCCADKSVYDPAAGARVVSGPAPQPLAAILIEHDAKTDELYAIGTFGGEKFNEFFQKYEFKLTLETGSSQVRDIVTKTAVLKDLAQFSQQTAQC